MCAAKIVWPMSLKLYVKADAIIFEVSVWLERLMIVSFARFALDLRLRLSCPWRVQLG